MESGFLDVAAAVAQALVCFAFLWHLSAKCLVPPQNMQRLLLRCHFHSSAVSLPSFLSLAVKSGRVELDVGLLASLEELGMLVDEVALPDLDQLPPELEGLGDKVDWDLEDRASLSLHSQ